MSKTNDPFFQGGRYGGKTAMQLEGLSVILNMPKALESRYDANGREVEQGLPPYNPRAAFQVDDYPAAPKEWLRSEPGQLSFMVPVVEEYGMWLDFNHNFEHSHDVAVVVSTQGVNAVTGLKTDAMRLEQYRDKCPVHNVPFGGNRRCEQCGFDWPSQNYLATTACRRPYLWLDGFRASNGETRQWVFTKDEDRSVAKAIIGAERVHALGIAFFLSKEPKPTPPPMSRLRSRGIATLGGGGFASATYGGATRSLRMGPEECVDPVERFEICLLYTSPSPRDSIASRMPSSA